jgi:O-antigen ligase
MIRTSSVALRPSLAAEHRSRLIPRLAQISLIAMICLSITAPVISISGSLPWFKIEQLILSILVFVYVWLVLAGLAQPIKPNAMFLIGAAYSICIMASMLYGWAFLGHAVIVRDFYEIPKAMFPVVFFTLGREIELPESTLRTLLSWFSLAIFLVCIYALAQWADLGFTHTLANYYSGGWHDEGALSHYRRVYSTMGNPNLLGQLMTWSVAAFVLAAVLKFGNRLRNIVMVLACLVTMVMTGSRYGLLNTALAIILIFALLLMNAKRRKASMIVLSVLLPVLIVVGYAVAKSNRATAERLQTLSNPFTTDSLRDRVDDLWRDAGIEIAQSPFLGHGPAKTIFSGVITDSEFLDVLKEFGLVGFSVYLLYFVYPLCSLWGGIKASWMLGSVFGENSPGATWVLHLGFVTGAVALVMNVGMSTFYNAALQSFLWIWLGIGTGTLRARA